MELGSDESMKGFEIFLQTSELCFKTLPCIVHKSLTNQQTNFPLGLLADSFPFFWKRDIPGSINDQTVAMIQGLVRGGCIMRDDTLTDALPLASLPYAEVFPHLDFKYAVYCRS